MPSHVVIPFVFFIVAFGTWFVGNKFRTRRAKKRIQTRVDSLKSRGWDQQDIYDVRQFIEFESRRPSKRMLTILVGITIAVFLFEIYLVLSIDALDFLFFLLNMVPIVILLFIVRNPYVKYVRAEEIRDYLRDNPESLLEQGSEILSFTFEENVDTSDTTEDWDGLQIETESGISSSVYEVNQGQSVYFSVDGEEEYEINSMTDQIDLENQSGEVVASIDMLPSKQVENVVYEQGEVRVDITEPQET